MSTMVKWLVESICWKRHRKPDLHLVLVAVVSSSVLV